MAESMYDPKEMKATDYATAMLSEIKLGVDKSESRFAGGSGFSELWDALEAFIKENPEAVIEIPGELA